MKILHIITRLDKGGSSTNTLLSAIGLEEKGHDVSLLYGDTKDPDKDLIERAKSAGVLIFQERSLVRDIHPVSDMAALFKIKNFISGGGYDVVHTHSSKAGLIGRLAAWMSGVRAIVYTPHGHVFYGYFSKTLTFVVRMLECFGAFFSDRIVGLTQAECEEWIAMGVGTEGQYVTVPSGIEFDKMDPEISEEKDIRADINMPEGSHLVGSIGRFVDVKGFEYFIAAAILQIEKRDDIFFVLAGDGALKGKYEEMIRSAGVENRFYLFPWQKNSEGFLNSLDIFVLSSLNEGMGRVLIEAMYLKKPVIATRVGGVPSILADDCGLLVDPGDSEAISEGLDLLLGDPDLALEMSDSAYSRVLSEYSAQVMVDKLDELYREILANKE